VEVEADQAAERKIQFAHAIVGAVDFPVEREQ
jgi:hypothetical protein